MYVSKQQIKNDQTADLRRMAGQWLRERRENRGCSQQDLARSLGIEYYTFVSQIENGRGRIPAQRYADWADALAIDRREFAIKMMSFYDPITFEMVFGES